MFPLKECHSAHRSVPVPDFQIHTYQDPNTSPLPSSSLSCASIVLHCDFVLFTVAKVPVLCQYSRASKSAFVERYCRISSSVVNRCSAHLLCLRIFVPLHLLHRLLGLKPDMIDVAVPIVADKERSVRCECHTYWPAADIAVATEPARDEILRGSSYAPIFEGDAHNLVARGDGPVPGAVEGDIQTIAIAHGELLHVLRREGQSQRCRMGLHLL